jgi:hypothetical protein
MAAPTGAMNRQCYPNPVSRRRGHHGALGTTGGVTIMLR